MDAKNPHAVISEAERELRLQRDSLMKILEAVSDGIYIVSPNCDIEYVNPVIEREFGKVNGRKCYEYFHGRAAPCPWCKNEAVFNGGSVRWEWHSDKTGKTYDLFDTPIANADGTVSKFEIFHDITDHKKTLEALRQSEEMLHKTFASLNEAVLMVDPRSRAIVLVNAAAERIFGYSREEMIGRTTAFLYEDEDKFNEFGRRLFAAFEKEPAFNAEYRMRRKNGEIFDTEHTVSKMLDESGGLGNVVSVVRDITERKRSENALRESEERYRETFYSSKAVKLLIDSEAGTIIDANAAACGYYGYSREQLTAMSVFQLNTLSRDEVAKEMEAAKSERRNYFIFRHRLASGDIRDVEVYSSPVTIKGRRILHSIIHDITERKSAEEKLKAAKDEAEAATVLKDKFVSLVAHDLKNPIGNSLLALKSLRARLKEGGAAIADDPLLAVSITANENMLRLIEDLLQMSRIRSGAIRPRLAFTDAHYLFQYAVDWNANDAVRKEITVANLVPPRTRLYCDMKLTGEILANLVSNAIKFSNKGDTVTIGGKAGEPSVFFIRDTGVGIPPDRLQSLFKYEVSTSTSGTGGERGTGIGLPLSNELVQSQGGALRIESEPGRGTTVTVSFRHVAPVALVVEDSEFDMQIARMFLKDVDIKVMDTAYGEEALRMMGRELPDLILLDINLPDISGFDILRRKGADPQIRDIPVIVITGSVDPNLADEAFRLGAVDFIKKPIQPEILTARVRRIVS